MRPHLKQLERVVWYPYSAGTGIGTVYYPAHDIQDVIIRGDMLENMGKVGSAGDFPPVPGPRSADWGFSTYLSAPGTGGMAPFDVALLLACGYMEVGGTGAADLYQHINGADYNTEFHNANLVAGGEIVPVCFDYYYDQLRRPIGYCVGNLTLTFRHNALAVATWRWLGLYDGIPAEVYPAVPYTSGVNGLGLPDWAPLPCQGMTARFGGYGTGATEIESEISELTVDLGNTLTPRPDMVPADGHASPVITKTAPVLTLLTEYDVVRYDAWTAALNEDLLNCEFTLGAGAGGLLTVSFTGKMKEYPVPETVDGKLMQRITLHEHPDYPHTLLYS